MENKLIFLNFPLCLYLRITMTKMFRLLITKWHKAQCSRTSHWGTRRNPKVELINELKLQIPSLADEALEKSCIHEEGTLSSELYSLNLYINFDIY